MVGFHLDPCFRRDDSQLKEMAINASFRHFLISCLTFLDTSLIMQDMFRFALVLIAIMCSGAVAWGETSTTVVITEVAWMGTQASANDEWIELFNPSAQEVNLTGWTLRWRDEVVELNGTIPAHGYYLLERSDETTVSDVPSDLIYSGGLRNGGESLQLLDGSGQVVDSANGDGGPWPAGDASRKATMQRVDPALPDLDISWQTFDVEEGAARDAQDQPIYGTPRGENRFRSEQAEANAPAAEPTEETPPSAPPQEPSTPDGKPSIEAQSQGSVWVWFGLALGVGILVGAIMLFRRL